MNVKPMKAARNIARSSFRINFTKGCADAQPFSLLHTRELK